MCTNDLRCHHWFLRLWLMSVVTESVRSGSMSEMLYADDLVLTSVISWPENGEP